MRGELPGAHQRRGFGAVRGRIGKRDAPQAVARLATRPVPIGSPAPANTIGMSDVACLTASTAGAAARHRARHGFERQPDPWRARDERLGRSLAMHLLSSVVRVQPVRRPGTLRAACRQCAQRRRLGGRAQAGHPAVSRGLAPSCRSYGPSRSARRANHDALTCNGAATVDFGAGRRLILEDQARQLSRRQSASEMTSIRSS